VYVNGFIPADIEILVALFANNGVTVEITDDKTLLNGRVSQILVIPKGDVVSCRRLQDIAREHMHPSMWYRVGL
jgi:hypothetical protein